MSNLMDDLAILTPPRRAGFIFGHSTSHWRGQKLLTQTRNVDTGRPLRKPRLVLATFDRAGRLISLRRPLTERVLWRKARR